MSTAFLRSQWRQNIRARPLHDILSTRQVRSSSQSANSSKGPPSPHARFYSDLVPAMIPVALLGSAIYLGLRLFQSKLSHERYLDEAHARIEQLESEIDLLRLQTEAPHKISSGTVSPQPRRWWWFG